MILYFNESLSFTENKVNNASFTRS